MLINKNHSGVKIEEVSFIYFVKDVQVMEDGLLRGKNKEHSNELVQVIFSIQERGDTSRNIANIAITFREGNKSVYLSTYCNVIKNYNFFAEYYSMKTCSV